MYIFLVHVYLRRYKCVCYETLNFRSNLFQWNFQVERSRVKRMLIRKDDWRGIQKPTESVVLWSSTINSISDHWNMVRHYIQQHKRLDNKLSESYVENRNHRDTIKTLQEKLRSSAGADPSSNDSRGRHITLLPNTNESGKLWGDVLT